MAQVVLIVGSKTDLPQVSKTVEVLKLIGVSVDSHVVSAHRNPDELRERCRTWRQQCEVFIAAAGWAAALPGAVGAEIGFMTPVIGIPLSGGPYVNDSLYAMTSMPPGCPVMVVPNPENAAIAAAQIVARTNVEVAGRLRDYLANQEKKRAPQYFVTEFSKKE